MDLAKMLQLLDFAKEHGLDKEPGVAKAIYGAAISDNPDIGRKVEKILVANVAYKNLKKYDR